MQTYKRIDMGLEGLKELARNEIRKQADSGDVSVDNLNYLSDIRDSITAIMKVRQEMERRDYERNEHNEMREDIKAIRSRMEIMV